MMDLNIQNHFYIIVGASATGKGVFMEQLCKEGLWERAIKVSTREHRGENDDIQQIHNEKLNILNAKKEKIEEQIKDAVGTSDTLKWDLSKIKEQIKEERLRVINEEYCGNGKGLVYFLNGNFYGIKTDDIPAKLQRNNVVVVCSDFNIISQLKQNENLAPYIRIIYIASTIDEKKLLERYKSRETISFDKISQASMKEIERLSSLLSSAGRLHHTQMIEEVVPQLNEYWNSVLPYFDTIKTRATNMRLLYNRYIDHIGEIDCSILNFYDLEYMFQQGRNFINKRKNKSTVKNAPLFIVCAAPSSGKATLMSIVNGLGKVNGDIVITTKYATRDARPTDGRDGMRAVGKDGNFCDYIKKEEDIWEWSFHGGKTRYAVDLSEIRKNIENGKAQIFISNMGQIDKARELFPNNAVILYLHTVHESATLKHIEEKRKSNQVVAIVKKYNVTELEAEQIIKNEATYLNNIKRDIEQDLEEIREVHIKFKDNNHAIDHVLVNIGTVNDLTEQIVNLIKLYK